MTASFKLQNNENDDDGNGVLRRPRLMTVFLVISSRRGRRGEVDILLVVTFPQHRNDEDAPDNHHGELCHSSIDKKNDPCSKPAKQPL